MKKCLLAFALGVSAFVHVQAQQRYNLQQSITIALENNLQLRQLMLQVQTNQNVFEQSKWQRYPTLNFSGSQGLQSGRNIDPFTNQFVEQTVNFSNFSLNTGVNVFNGYQQKNIIKQNQLNVQATQKDVESNRNALVLNVASAYITLLNNQEQLEFARRQAETTRLQLDRTERLVKAGSLSQINLYDIQSQLANDELSIVNAQNNIELAKLTLKQYLNLPASEAFEIEPITLPAPSSAPYNATLEQVYNAAIKYLPDLDAANLRIESAKTAIEIARGAKLPSITLGGGLSSSFSSAAPKQRFVGDGGESKTVDVPSSTRYVSYAGFSVPVIEKVTIPSGAIQNFGYFDQLGFNRNASLSLSLRMPIFNGYQVRYRIANAMIQQKNQEYQYQIIQNQIRQTVEQAYYSMVNAAKRYEATSRQIESLELSFKAAELRLNAGAINATEYNIAKTNLDRSRASLIQAKYEFLFRTKILDFYQSRSITLE
ncbi:TolC family protein [Runella slithyformis]|uniref:Outer membrane efflux protein n=1 Tax=Runella slithyformis (strain ATCC 29530 / DSM 19594 / LMG 11500 / NCIMB 11436 / LSU 4) TaxID=761193 RepID=A0A7U3ZLL1_RUNSL|nr:TolC family protein [Runella slithyformis]AEI49450.1 outer membrane efflux protein [Runella slithyformis DSM 19594]